LGQRFKGIKLPGNLIFQGVLGRGGFGDPGFRAESDRVVYLAVLILAVLELGIMLRMKRRFTA
jgi:hypothetical protein